ncbi:MAG TPA: c-type cytochrome [Saprospiraceae bacterium]|nr:c-type cytochrome [Saprospiraceae bacterium]
MNFKLSLLLLTFIVVLTACENKKDKISKTVGGDAASATPTTENYDPKRGEGKYTEASLNLGATIDDAMAESGSKIQGVKCSSCHKLGTEKLVGPGWKGVTTRRTPSWIMNFITNPDPMINKDPELQAQLELCLVRMPNQNLTDDDARHVLEFMRKNDAAK